MHWKHPDDHKDSAARLRQRDYYLLKGGKHKNFQCKCCRLQTSLIAGTLFQSTNLTLSIWFLAIYLISQAKTGLSALDLKQQMDVSYPTAWLIQQKLMQAMVNRDAKYSQRPLQNSTNYQTRYNF